MAKGKYSPDSQNFRAARAGIENMNRYDNLDPLLMAVEEEVFCFGSRILSKLDDMMARLDDVSGSVDRISKSTKRILQVIKCSKIEYDFRLEQRMYENRTENEKSTAQEEGWLYDPTGGSAS